MQLTLSDEEAQTLRRILRDYLPGLRLEFARTEIAARELRHELVKRQELCERLFAELEPGTGSSPVKPA
jgi:hypothetical protein